MNEQAVGCPARRRDRQPAGRQQRGANSAVGSGSDRAPVLLDLAKRHDIVVEDGIDLDMAAEGAHVVGQRAQIEILRVLDPGDVGLGHLQHLGKLGLRLSNLLPQLGQANRRDDRALASVDLSGGAGAPF